MRFYTQEDLCLEQVGFDVWRIGLTKTATRPNGVTSSWSYEDKRNLLTQVQNGAVSCSKQAELFPDKKWSPGNC